ncbi:MAG: DUF4157 domain-containing protein [Nannocystaceae bacterium]
MQRQSAREGQNARSTADEGKQAAAEVARAERGIGNRSASLAPGLTKALHRGAGNRAITRAVQASRDPAGARGETSSASILDAARRGTRGPGGALPHLAAIQRSFGPDHDLSGVRAHVGGDAASASATMGAEAFAFGDRVAFRGAPSLHVAAHEAAHVIQQRRGVSLYGGVGRAGDRYERQADEVAARVVAGRSAADLLGAPGRAGGSIAGVQGSPAVQRLEVGERPFKDGYKSLTSDPSWLPKAEAYEKRLGIYAYSHATAEQALDGALNKMEEVIQKEYDAVHLSAEELRDLYREVFTKDDPGSAGQVGTDLSFDEIGDLLGDGNLRERMTAFYNAAYYNSDPSRPPLSGLKKITADILMLSEESVEDLETWGNWMTYRVNPWAKDRKSWGTLSEEKKAKATTLGLDEVDLTKKRDFYHGSWLRTGVKAATSMTSVGYNFADDPFALGNLTLERELTGTTEMAVSQVGRVKRSPTEMTAEKRTAQDYEDLGIGLSEREKAYTKGKMTGVSDVDYPTTKLPWIEGHTYYGMSSDNLWVKEIRGKLRMPVVAGVSGTTTRMLTAFKWLNTGIDPLDFRLAILGWMLPAWDHSLYEILRGAHLAGVKGAGEGDLDDVINMYMNVPPLTPVELRTHVATAKKFPHEEVYMDRMEPDRSLATGFKSVFGESNYGTDLAISGDPSVSEAHAAAIFGYTSGIHSLMNAVLNLRGIPGARRLGSRTIASKLKDSARYACRYEYLDMRETNGSITPAEQIELNDLKDNEIETIDALEKEDHLETWTTYCRTATRTREEVETYISETVFPWIDSISSDLYDEMKIHTNMTIEALARLPPVNGVTVYRGDWSSVVASRYEKGSVIDLPEFNSFSTDEDVAMRFAKGGKVSNAVLLTLQLTGRGGRDISAYSKFGDENEVLMMPGSKIRITDVTWSKLPSGADLKEATAVEV